MQTRIAQVLARGGDELLAAVCREMVECGGYRLAAIGEFDEAVHRTRFFACAGEDRGYVDELGARAGDWSETVFDAPVPGARQWGFSCSVSLPIVLEGRVWGSLIVFRAEAGGFCEREIRVLGRIAADIARSLESRRREAALRSAEQRILHLHRIHAVWSGINQAILRVRDGQALYREVCRIAVEQGHFPAAWIGVPDHATGEIRAAAQTGDLEEYLGAIRLNFRAESPTPGPLLTALRETRIVVCNDIANDAGFRWRETALRSGLRSVAVFPLRGGERVRGALIVYGDAPGYFGPDEVSLLEEMAADISFAIGFLEQEDRRQLAEAALAESEARFANAFQYAAIGMALVGLDGRGFKVNRAVCSLLGYAEEELLGLSYSDITHPDDLPADNEQVRRLLAGEISAYQMEKRYLHKSGRVVWGLLSVSLVRDREGRPVHFIAQIQDISARQEAIEKLQHSEERYRKLTDNFPLGTVATYNRDLRITFAGGAVLRQSADGAANLLGRHFRDVSPESWDIAEPHLARAFAGETVVFEAPGPGGRTYRVTAAALYGADGGIEEVLVVSQDITGQRLAAEAIRRNEERLRRTQAVGHVGSWELDLWSGLLWGSDEAFRLYGLPYGSGEVSPAAIDACIPDAGRVRQRVEELIAGAADPGLEFEVRPADGSPPRILKSVGELLRNAEGEPVKVIGVVQDVTERKQAEDAVLRSRQQLRALSARLETLREEERTRIAREIHDELGQMLTGIKMDLRWVERRLDEPGGDPRLHPILDKLADAGELTDTTVRTVQRIAAELRPGILDKLGLPAALEYEAEQFRRRTRIACRLRVPSGAPRLRPQAATAFFRIFQEALTNVSRHSAATAVEAEFRVGADECRLEIRDNGKGITASDLARPSSLGLLGMQERARLLGGDVSFAARSAGGTVVTVVIPAAGGPKEAL